MGNKNMEEKNISKIDFSVILYSVFVLFYSIGGLLEINWIVTILNMDNRAFLVSYLVISLFWGVGNIILLIISLFKNKKERSKKVILITWNTLLVTLILFLLVVTYLSQE
jgi:hypothetical protein